MVWPRYCKNEGSEFAPLSLRIFLLHLLENNSSPIDDPLMPIGKRCPSMGLNVVSVQFVFVTIRDSFIKYSSVVKFKIVRPDIEALWRKRPKKQSKRKRRIVIVYMQNIFHDWQLTKNESTETGVKWLITRLIGTQIMCLSFRSRAKIIDINHIFYWIPEYVLSFPKFNSHFIILLL